MATVSHQQYHHHAMRPSYPLCHHQPSPPAPSQASQTVDAATNSTGGHGSGGGGAAAAGLVKTISSVGGGGGGGLGTAVPTVPYFYPTTNQVSISCESRDLEVLSKNPSFSLHPHPIPSRHLLLLLLSFCISFRRRTERAFEIQSSGFSCFCFFVAKVSRLD